jgi:2-methylisocitrate lyase-like PEP mutase family enzyme
MSEKKTAISPAAKLRAMLAEKDKIVVCPGVYDGFTARIALAAGFDCLYMVSVSTPPLFMAKLTPSTQTGSGTTMSKLGMADLGFATLNDMVGNAGMIASLDRSVPLIADADTGYGGKLHSNLTFLLN